MLHRVETSDHNILDKDLLKYRNIYTPSYRHSNTSYVEIVPPKIRRKIAREGHKKRPSKEIHLTTTTRKKHMTEFAQSLNVLISPSEYLAEQASTTQTS